MKRVILVLLMSLVMAGFAFAQEPAVNNWDSHFKGGDTSVSIGVGLGFYPGLLSLAAYPGFEQTITDFKIGDVFPLSIGAAAKGLVNLYVGGYSGIVVGVGGFVPFHVGLKGLGLEFLDNLDFYFAPGIAITFDTGDLGWTNPLDIGFAEYSGINYFLDDGMAVFVEQVYWAYYSGATVGVLFRF